MSATRAQVNEHMGCIFGTVAVHLQLRLAHASVPSATCQDGVTPLAPSRWSRAGIVGMTKASIGNDTHSAQRSSSTLALASACRLRLQNSIKRDGQVIDELVYGPLLLHLPVHTQPSRPYA
eukprot:COSAG02_NODE_2538_length_8577_cov_16.981835_4_plen_121_part_00